MRIVIKAPAKINLHLSVLSRRFDAYHDILSLMQMISLYDTVTIGLGDECPADRDAEKADRPGPENTVWRAHRAFSEYTGISDAVWIRLEKVIPTGAGMGGGSSDAAATLLGLNALFRSGLSGADLEKLGLGIGMDVPFFLRSPAALVQGRGEVLTALAPRTDFVVVVAFPGVSVSTEKAYKLLDKAIAPDDSHSTIEYAEALAAMYNESAVVDWKFTNSFRKLLPDIYPKGMKICRLLGELGASYANLTGSGSAIIGIFTDSEHAEAAALVLKEQLPWVVISMPLELKPVPVLKYR